MIDSTNIIFCSSDRKAQDYMEDFINSSVISQYRVSSFDDIPSNLKKKNLNLIILEINEENTNRTGLIKKMERSENNIKSILLVKSEKVLESIEASLKKNELDNYLVNPYRKKHLEELIKKLNSEFIQNNGEKDASTKRIEIKEEPHKQNSSEASEAIINENKEILKQEKIVQQPAEEQKIAPKTTIQIDDLTENSPLIIFTIKENKFTFANKKAAQTFGYTKEELLNTNPANLISKKELRDALVGVKELTGTEENTKKISIQLRTKKDEKAVVEGELRYKPDSDTFQFYLSQIGTSEQNSEENLRLAAAVKSINSAITITDTDRNIIYVNPTHKGIFGYDPEELIGRSSKVLYPSQDPTGVSEKIYDAVFLLGWQGERIATKKNGDVFPVYEKTSAIKGADGKEIGIVSVQDDITQRKRLEQALKESEEKYRTLIETASTPVITVNDKGIINLFNPAAEKLFEYEDEEVIDKNIVEFISKNFRKHFEDGFNKDNEIDILHYIENTMEIKGLKKGGDEFPMEVSISKCKIEGREVFTIIIFDITERKNLEQQLLQSAKLAAVGELISGVTHEVNNPLAVVLGYSEMLIQEHEADEELLKIVKIIHSESERARKVIHNLLSFARQHKPDKELVKINEVIDNTISLTEYDLRKHKIEIEKNYDESLPSILADPNQLQQVFLNLIINAQHAIADQKNPGKIIISTGKSDGSDHVEICIEDSGPGIPEKILEKIFDPFFTTKPVGKGTGLGLSVSFGIIERHSGRISVESEEGRGTKFHIVLPLDTTPKDQTEDEAFS